MSDSFDPSDDELLLKVDVVRNSRLANFDSWNVFISSVFSSIVDNLRLAGGCGKSDEGWLSGRLL